MFSKGSGIHATILGARRENPFALSPFDKLSRAPHFARSKCPHPPRSLATSPTRSAGEVRNAPSPALCVGEGWGEGKILRIRSQERSPSPAAFARDLSQLDDNWER